MCPTTSDRFTTTSYPASLIFLQNLSAFIVGFYSTKINKLGHTDKTSDEAIYAPLFLTILSAILCYGLADKIYI